MVNTAKERLHVIVCHSGPQGDPYPSPIATVAYWRRADALAALDRLLGGPDRATLAICDVGTDGSLRPIRERVEGAWAPPSTRTVDALREESVHDLAPTSRRRGM